MPSNVQDDDINSSVETIEISTIPWLNWCRLCGTEECHGLFGTEDIDEIQNLTTNTILNEVLEYLFHIKVCDDDELMPQFLCKNCLYFVSNTIAFHEHVLTVQNMYSNLTNNRNLEMDLKELRLESRVDKTEIESIFAGFKKGWISFKHLLADEEEAIRLAAKHTSYLESQAENVTKESYDDRGLESTDESFQKNPSQAENTTKESYNDQELETADDSPQKNLSNSEKRKYISKSKSKRKLPSNGLRRSARNASDKNYETNTVCKQEIEEIESEPKVVASKRIKLENVQENSPKRIKLENTVSKEKTRNNKKGDELKNIKAEQIESQQKMVASKRIKKENKQKVGAKKSKLTKTLSKGKKLKNKKKVAKIISTQVKTIAGSQNKLLETKILVPKNKKLLKEIKEITTKPVVVLEDISEQPLQLTCKECNYQITSFKLYDEHLRKAHCNLLKENKPGKCLECEEDFENMNKLKKHFKDKHQPELPLYKCNECALCFRTLNALRLHARTEHDNMKPFTCKECGIMVSSEPILRKHMMVIHVDEIPFECEHCKQKFKLKSALKTHIKDMHSGLEKTCKICGLAFMSSASLSNHYEVHSKEIIKCEICGLRMKHKRNHKRHMLTHTGLRLFSCVICEKTFTCATSRRTHMKAKHPEELEAYDKAGGMPKQLLPSKEDLKEETSKWIANGALDSDVRHICHICGKIYKLEEALKSHVLAHSAAKKIHICEICRREFNNDTSLRRHFISHTNLKLFSCEFCEKKFSYSSPCRTHMKEKHPNELEVFEELGLQLKIHLPTLEELRAANKITDETKDWFSE